MTAIYHDIPKQIKVEMLFNIDCLLFSGHGSFDADMNSRVKVFHKCQKVLIDQRVVSIINVLQEQIYLLLVNRHRQLLDQVQDRVFDKWELRVNVTFPEKLDLVIGQLSIVLDLLYQMNQT